MIKILVTGAKGQLGQWLRRLTNQYTSFQFTFADKQLLDITSNSQLSKVFKKENYTHCINCAAYTDVEGAEIQPSQALEVNAEGVKNLAEVCSDNNVILIHISTDYVFDGKKSGGYYPEDMPNPLNQYGLSKLKGERYIQEILTRYYIVRTSWLYSEIGNNFYTKILEKAAKESKLYVTDNQTGCPTNAKDLAYFILNLISSENIDFGIHHFTGGKAMTWFEFAVNIIQSKGLGDKVKVVRRQNYRSFAKRPTNSILLSRE